MSAKALYFNGGRFEQISDLLATSLDVAAGAVVLDSGGITLDDYLNINLAAGGEVLGLPATPSDDTAAASKAYVDSVATGLDVKASVRVATTAALPAYTRVGNVITADANGNINSPGIDGITDLVISNRILLKDGAAGADNGIYEVTTVGNAGEPFVLTRTSDADTSPEVTAGMFTFVIEGTANGGKGFVLVTPDAITLNTTSLSFSQFSEASTFSIDGLADAVTAATDDYIAIADTSNSNGNRKVLVSALITTVFDNIPSEVVTAAKLAPGAIQADSDDVGHLSFQLLSDATIGYGAKLKGFYVDSVSGKAKIITALSSAQASAFVGLSADDATAAEDVMRICNMSGILIQPPTAAINDNSSTIFANVGSNVYLTADGRLTTTDADIPSASYYVKVGVATSSSAMVTSFGNQPVLKP